MHTYPSKPVRYGDRTYGPAVFRPQLHEIPPDLMGVVGFASRAVAVLQLTPVIAPAVLSAPAALTPAGNTNVTAALRLAREWLRALPRHMVRRIVLVGDGEPNVETRSLVETVAQCRNDWIAIDTILCGTERNGSEVLRSISTATVGGQHFAANSYQQLKDQVVSAAGRQHRRHGATVVAVDCSASMSLPMPGGGGTRIAAAIAACQAAALIRRTAFGRVGGMQ